MPHLLVSPICLRLPALAMALALIHPAHAEDQTPPACPVGVLQCPKKTDLYAQCKRNDLLEFFTPGLPTAGNRAAAITDVSARKVSASDRTHEQLEGEVELHRLDALLKADFLTFETETTDYTAQGHVVYQDHGILVGADHARGTGTPSTTYLDNVRYQMLSSRGSGIAATANMTDPDHGNMHASTFSTCDPDDRQWEIRARDMELDQTENKGHAHAATMYYHDVPFFYFPYLTFPLSDERESGFLYPHVGYTRRRGFDLGLPYYLNLAPNYDATLYPAEMTRRGPMLGGDFRFLTEDSKGEIDFNYVPHDQEADRERSSFRAIDSSSFSENWSASVNINHVSDVNYFQDFGNALTTTATALLASSAYVAGRGEWWNTTFGGDSFELTDPSLIIDPTRPNLFEPYRRLPRATLQAEHAVLGDLAAGINSEYVNFHKDDALNTQRLDLYPYLAYPIEHAAYFIRPELGLRYTRYDLTDDRTSGTPLATTDPSRKVPIFDLDSGLIFDRATSFFGNDYTQTLEPRLYYLRVPFRDQSGLPIFDTQLPTFDFPGLFRTNTFTGADRQTNANNLTVAVTSRLIDADSGDQLLSASLGQIRYFDPQRVQLPGLVETDFSGSDYVGDLDLRLNDRWRIQWDQQYNPNTHKTDLSAVGFENRFGADGVANLSYRFRRNLLEQVDATTLVPISERWSVIGRYDYSLKDKRVLESFVGVEYDSCCVALRALVRHFIHSTITGKIGDSDDGLYFELEFKGIGSTGQRTENFLRRAMLGYQ